MRRITRQLAGKMVIGVISGRMSSNNRDRTETRGLVLMDARGCWSYLYFHTIEETDGAFYGHDLSYPGRAPRPELGDVVEVIA